MLLWVPRANRHLNSARGDGVGKKGKVFHLSENRSQNTWQDKEGVGYFLPPTADVSEYQVSGNLGRGLNSAPQIIYSTMDQYKADSSVCVCNIRVYIWLLIDDTLSALSVTFNMAYAFCSAV